jgi:hypothetical protein
MQRFSLAWKPLVQSFMQIDIKSQVLIIKKINLNDDVDVLRRRKEDAI